MIQDNEKFSKQTDYNYRLNHCKYNTANELYIPRKKLNKNRRLVDKFTTSQVPSLQYWG